MFDRTKPTVGCSVDGRIRLMYMSKRGKDKLVRSPRENGGG